MKKKEILKFFHGYNNVISNENNSAVGISILTKNIDVFITIPFIVYEIFFEAKDKDGNLLVKDWFDFYGENEFEDFIETLHDIIGVMKKPKFRISNKEKTVEAYGFKWYYFFGEFNCS